MDSIFVCQFHVSATEKSCRKKKHCHHPVRMEGRRSGMMKELLSSSLLVSIPFYFCLHFLRSLLSVYCHLLGSDGLLVNPHFTLLLVLAQLCWLMMCSVWQPPLWVLAMGGKPWFPSQALVFRVDWALIIHDGKLHRTAFRLRHRSSSLFDDFPSYFFSLSPARTPGDASPAVWEEVCSGWFFREWRLAWWKRRWGPL